jgi:hypothetical protein
MDMHLPAARSRRGIPRSVVALALATLFVAAIGQVALAAPPDEVPGNNGTVKIHDGAGEPSSEVRNEPHVCTFHLHFFFADAGDSGTWEIQEWSPGDKGTVVLTGTYLTDANGEDRDPDAGTYSLPDGHYKLFWDGDLDTNKHDKMKVFWVECPPTAGGGQPAGATPTPTPPTGGVQPAESTPTPPTGGEQGTGSGPTGQVLGAFGASGNTLPATDTLAAPAPVAGSDGWAGWVATIGIVSLLVLLASPAFAREAIRLSRRR